MLSVVSPQVTCGLYKTSKTINNNAENGAICGREKIRPNSDQAQLTKTHDKYMVSGRINGVFLRGRPDLHYLYIISVS